MKKNPYNNLLKHFPTGGNLLVHLYSDLRANLSMVIAILSIVPKAIDEIRLYEVFNRIKPPTLLPIPLRIEKPSRNSDF